MGSDFDLPPSKCALRLHSCSWYCSFPVAVHTPSCGRRVPRDTGELAFKLKLRVIENNEHRLTRNLYETVRCTPD